MLIGMKADGLGWREVQYRRSHLFSSFVLGTLVGFVFLIGAGKISGLPAIFSVSGVAATLQFTIVGFAEETLFRGYVQTRWVAALGWWPGLLLASTVMSLFHVPILLMAEMLTPARVLVETLQMMPVSLLLGYAMHKSGNIVAPATIHLWLNMSEVL